MWCAVHKSSPVLLKNDFQKSRQSKYNIKYTLKTGSPLIIRHGPAFFKHPICSTEKHFPIYMTKSMSLKKINNIIFAPCIKMMSTLFAAWF